MFEGKTPRTRRGLCGNIQNWLHPGDLGQQFPHHVREHLQQPGAGAAAAAEGARNMAQSQMASNLLLLTRRAAGVLQQNNAAALPFLQSAIARCACWRSWSRPRSD
jgi:hypothetical protein